MLSVAGVEWPQDDEVSEECMDFVTKLLHPNPLHRLGAQGVQEIKQHPFFNGIVWKVGYCLL
jgi:hypothetical protein